MGTRATVKFYAADVFLCCVYHHCDGYIKDDGVDGVGNKLKKFLKSKLIFNNSITKKQEPKFKAPGCLVAQYIAENKKGIGDLYIAGEDNLQDFNYRVHINSKLTNNFDYTYQIKVSCDRSSEYEELI